VSGEGRPRTPMGIRGALGPVGYSDPSLRDSRSQLARLEIHNPGTFVSETEGGGGRPAAVRGRGRVGRPRRVGRDWEGMREMKP